MIFYYVYVLQSLNHDFLYVGFTEDLKRRFKEHNNGEELSTKHYTPFELIHYEAYRNENDVQNCTSRKNFTCPSVARRAKEERALYKS